MSTEYTFDFMLADATRDDMASITRNLQSMLAELDGNVQAVLADWNSDAREAYNVSKAKWDAAAGAMPLSLGRAEQALAEISGGYLRVEHTGTGMWGQ